MTRFAVSLLTLLHTLAPAHGQWPDHVIGENQGSYDTRAVDMDKDGDLDILIAGHASNNVVFYENPAR